MLCCVNNRFESKYLNGKISINFYLITEIEIERIDKNECD